MNNNSDKRKRSEYEEDNNNENKENKENKKVKIVQYDNFDDFLKDLMEQGLKEEKKKRNPLLIDNSSDSESESDSEDESLKEEEKEYEHIDAKVKSIDDLIELGKKYDSNKRYNIDLKTLNNLVKPLEDLKKMIGMTSVKENIVDHIIFYLQKFDDGGLNDMLHTVIQGPPGVGKTELGKILSKIYLAMGILKNDKFIVAKRSDLIGKYLGHTASQTQKIINSAKGGVLFIDEAYSLGNPEGRDMFSKECLDTINQNLTENKKNFLCIIAGYKDALDNCFFSYNEGLSRRFSIRYTIEPYTHDELKLIFIKIVKSNNWSVSDDLDVKIFKENKDNFKFFGGDMETLFFACKVVHARRVFCLEESNKKVITNKDVEEGLKIFKKNKEIDKKDPRSEYWKNLYI
jgi:SpoVK/Ycf46/Vps4 family AAA+-type ATPase